VPFLSSCWNFFSSIDILIAFRAYENSLLFIKRSSIILHLKVSAGVNGMIHFNE
jgi:hypothetical protein